MKDLRSTGPCQLIALLAILVILFSSCEKDEDAAPDYVGKWVTAKTIPASNGYTLIVYSLTLTKHTFIETFLTNIHQSTPTYPGTFVTMEGTVSVSGKTMKLIVHQVSYSTYNASTKTASEPHETYAFEDEDFGFSFGGIGMSTSNHQCEYSILGNEMVLKIDYDSDGDYSDNRETIVYTRLD